MESTREICSRCFTLKNTEAGHRTLTVQALIGHSEIKEIAKFEMLSLHTCEACGTHWSFDPGLGWQILKESDLREKFLASQEA